MSITEEAKVNLSSCKITKETIKQVCELIDIQVKELKTSKIEDDESREVTYILETKNKKITSNSYEAFLNANWSSGIEGISIRYFGSINISILIEFGSIPLRYFSVSGKDAIKVNGITAKLEEIFNPTLTKNYLFHKIKSLAPIAILCGTLLELGAQFVYEVYVKHNLHPIIPSSSTIPFSMLFIFASGWFLSWLFPMGEFEDHFIQTRIRKAIVPIIIGIVIALVGSAIWKVISD